MKRPSRLRHWVSDVATAFDKAAKSFDSGRTDLKDQTELYRLAPAIAARRRKVSDPQVVAKMEARVASDAAYEFSVDPDAKEQYLFQFVFAYVHCHVAAGLLTEKEADVVMDHLNEKIDLFYGAA